MFIIGYLQKIIKNYKIKKIMNSKPERFSPYVKNYLLCLYNDGYDITPVLDFSLSIGQYSTLVEYLKYTREEIHNILNDTPELYSSIDMKMIDYYYKNQSDLDEDIVDIYLDKDLNYSSYEFLNIMMSNKDGIPSSIFKRCHFDEYQIMAIAKYYQDNDGDDFIANPKYTTYMMSVISLMVKLNIPKEIINQIHIENYDCQQCYSINAILKYNVDLLLTKLFNPLRDYTDFLFVEQMIDYDNMYQINRVIDGAYSSDLYEPISELFSSISDRESCNEYLYKYDFSLLSSDKIYLLNEAVEHDVDTKVYIDNISKYDCKTIEILNDILSYKYIRVAENIIANNYDIYKLIQIDICVSTSLFSDNELVSLLDKSAIQLLKLRKEKEINHE